MSPPLPPKQNLIIHLDGDVLDWDDDFEEFSVEAIREFKHRDSTNDWKGTLRDLSEQIKYFLCYK